MVAGWTLSDRLDLVLGQAMPPHGHCYLWNEYLVALHAAGDLIIALAYFSIPVALAVIARRRRDLTYNAIFWLFSAFIFLCGLTHLLAVYNIWNSAYWLSGGVKLLTAIASVSAAMVIWPLMPRILAIPSHDTLMALNEQLSLEVRQRQQAQAQAERAAQAKAEFLANMSHEVRTPITGILGAIELIKDSDSLRKQREYLDIITRSAESLLTVVNGILDYSRLETGQIALESLPFQVDELAAEVVAAMQPAALEKGLILAMDVEPVRGRWYLGDRHALRQVLTNLIGNAIKFTEQGGVDLRIEAEPVGDAERITVQVVDTGVGIAADQRGHIFESFTQADASVRRRFGGTGLGLSISNQLVRLMGSAGIGVDSEPGRGSTFYFSIVLPPGEAPGPPDRVAEADVRQYHKLALLVDDNQVNRLLGSRLLNQLGVEVIEAADGFEALERLQQHPVDVVLMDLQMPGMDGLEATRRIRRGEALNPSIPVIAMTANVLAEHRRQCEEAGMQGFLAKPFRRDDIIRALDQLFPPAGGLAPR
jgi:signal transduction histidine kinase/ActR/RegA family two-component response regulator